MKYLIVNKVANYRCQKYNKYMYSSWFPSRMRTLIKSAEGEVREAYERILGRFQDELGEYESSGDRERDKQFIRGDRNEQKRERTSYNCEIGVY